MTKSVFAGLFSLLFLVFGVVLAYSQTGSPFSTEGELARIQRMIEENSYRWTAGKTSLSELSDQEKEKRLGLVLPKGYEEFFQGQKKFVAKAPASFPVTFDWRDYNGVSPVKNQGSCGSCWDFAATAVFESQILIKDGMLFDLSEQQVLSCNIYEAGCGGGWEEAAYELWQRFGAIDEGCMLYSADDSRPCTQEICTSGVAAKIKGWVYIDNDVNAIKTAVQQIGPIATAMTVYNDFFYYIGGCYDHANTPDPVNHAVTIIGWDDTICGGSQGAWLVKNSWGADWGDSGYFYIKYGSCKIGSYSSIVSYPPDPVQLAYKTHQPSDSLGDGDGFLDPGDTITLSVTLKNSASDTATQVEAELSSSTLEITIIDSIVSFPDIPPGEERTSEEFVLVIDSSVTPGTKVNFTLDITANEGSWQDSLYDFVGKFDAAFFDDMENGDRGWTHGFTQNRDDWQRGIPNNAGGRVSDPDTAYSGTKVWGNKLGGNYADTAVNYLNSPVINCRRFEKVRLQYQRFLACEKGIYDQAKIYVNGNLVWQNNSSFDHIDYDWKKEDIGLSVYADSNPSVQVKFELDTDEYLHLGGWNIDNFALLGILKYIAGDVNHNRKIELADVISLAQYILNGAPIPDPLYSGDVNCDEKLELADVIYLAHYLLMSGPSPCHY